MQLFKELDLTNINSPSWSLDCTIHISEPVVRGKSEGNTAGTEASLQEPGIALKRTYFQNSGT